MQSLISAHSSSRTISFAAVRLIWMSFTFDIEMLSNDAGQWRAAAGVQVQTEALSARPLH
jgi:hypothetical protein